MGEEDRETRGIEPESRVSFRHCPQCRRYRTMVKINNKWQCTECGYQEEIKTGGS